MRNKLIIACMTFAMNWANGQDLVSGGSNSWLFHTPDDGRSNLFIAPMVNGTWRWDLQTNFENNGDVNFPGTIRALKGDFSGNIKVLAQEGAWGEGINIIRPSGWAGIRLTRNDPSTSNFQGNWAIGYNGNTGEDFSISNHWNGVQYNHLLHIKADSRNVGIGTANPNARLDVNGVIQTYNKDTELAYWDNLRLWSDGENSYIESNGDEKGMILQSKGGNKIALMSSVGVGTTDTKGFKLAVAGPMVAESVKVQLQNSWVYPDYVFKPAYKLPTLHDVESFIKKNQHLPEIPSEKEAKDNGIDLGEMNAKLLKKIEELTLYMIEQEKRINTLEKQIKKK